MVSVDEALRRSALVTTADLDVIVAVDRRELRGTVTKRLPGLATVARVCVGELEDWRAARAANSSSEGPAT